MHKNPQQKPSTSLLTWVQKLRDLFQAHPAQHLELGRVQPATRAKEVRTRPGGATPAHFTKHLRAKRDFGGLGVHPGRPDRPKGERAQWFTTWFALDLDGTKPPQLEDFLIELMHHDLMAYPSTGTTGGGSHLWFFLESPIPVAVAHKLALSLAELARAHGAQTVEVRPSAPYGPGSGILLPYRGAAADGYGFNPLLEPLGDYSPISMEQLETIHLNSLEAVEAVMLQPRTERTKPRQRTSVEHPEARWADELERLGPLWLRGRRNALTLGATSFGLHLGIDPERAHCPPIRRHRTGDHADRGGLARTIRAEEHSDLARRHMQREIGERLVAGEGLVDVVDGDHALDRRERGRRRIERCGGEG